MPRTIVTAQTALFENMAPAVRGRVFGVLASIVSAASLIPILVAGPLADASSGAAVIGFTAACVIGSRPGRRSCSGRAGRRVIERSLPLIPCDDGRARRGQPCDQGLALEPAPEAWPGSGEAEATGFGVAVASAGAAELDGAAGELAASTTTVPVMHGWKVQT